MTFDQFMADIAADSIGPATIIECAECGSQIGVPRGRWRLAHYEDGSHAAYEPEPDDVPLRPGLARDGVEHCATCGKPRAEHDAMWPHTWLARRYVRETQDKDDSR